MMSVDRSVLVHLLKQNLTIASTSDFILKLKSGKMRSILLLKSEGGSKTGFKGHCDFTLVALELHHTVVRAMSSLSSVTVCAAIARTTNNGAVSLLVVAERSSSAVSTDGSLHRRQLRLDVRVLWIGECPGHIGPCYTGEADAVSGKLHQSVYCPISKNDTSEGCETFLSVARPI